MGGSGQCAFWVGVCVLGGRVYAVGGNYGGNYLASVERHGGAKIEWEAVVDTGTALLRRCSERK